MGLYAFRSYLSSNGYSLRLGARKVLDIPPLQLQETHKGDRPMHDSWEKYRIQGEQAEAANNYPYAEAMWAMAVLVAQTFGEKDPRLPYSLDSLSRCLMRQQKFVIAENFLSRCWQIKTQVNPAPPLEIAATLNLVAELYFRQARYADSYSICQKVLQVYLGAYGETHAKTTELQANMAMLDRLINPQNYATATGTAINAVGTGTGSAVNAVGTGTSSALNAVGTGTALNAVGTGTNSALNAVGTGTGTANNAVSSSHTPDKKGRQGRPRCETCGAIMEAEWCFRCTGNSVKAIAPGNKLT